MVERVEQGATVLVSSHLLALVEDICGHLVILRQGKCLFSGSVAEARDNFGETSSLEEVFFRVTGESEQ